MEGISPRVARRRRYQTEVIEQKKDGRINENLCEKFGCLVNFQQLYSMEKNLTCEELLAENQNLKHRIMMLERMLFWAAKRIVLSRMCPTTSRVFSMISFRKLWLKKNILMTV